MSYAMGCRGGARATRPLVFTVLLGVLAASAVAQPGARLSDIPALARARNERQRPRIEAALAPYAADLVMDYATNKAYLDTRIEQIAALGDSLVPLLLEKLRPADGSPELVNTAANAARVLAKLGPGGFVPPLIELARSENTVARGHAIHLLGRSGHADAGAFLEEILGSLPRQQLAPAVQALRRLAWRPAAAKVAGLLPGSDSALRQACLEFLTELGGSDTNDAVLAALGRESHESLIPAYLDYLKAHAAGDGEAATALLAFLEPGRLLPPMQSQVAQALATVAPKGHDPTCTRLKAIIEGGELRQLGRACAVTMLALGDSSGRKELLEGLEKALRKAPKSPLELGDKGEALYAFEKWGEALATFREAERNARSTTAKRSFQVWIARCYVRMQQGKRAAAVLRDAGVSKLDLDAAAAEDPAFKQALAEHSDLRALARDLNR